MVHTCHPHRSRRGPMIRRGPHGGGDGLHCIRHSGERMWIERSVTPAADTGGCLLGVIASLDERRRQAAGSRNVAARSCTAEGSG